MSAQPASRNGQTFWRAWRAATREDRVLLAPIISMLGFAVVGINSRSLLAGIFAMLIQTVLFQIVVTAHIERPRLRRAMFIAAPIVVIAVFALIGVIAAAFGGDYARGLAALFSALMTAGVIARIFGRVAHAPVINAVVVVRAISVYVLIGLLYAYLFIAMSVTGNDFFVQGPQPNAVFLYFSYVTLATVGYGDFTPAYDAARLLAVSEGLIGQLYLVTVLALIVSNLGRERGKADASPRSDDSG